MLMSIIQPILFGLLQAITEFLPISSSGHLLILHNFWPSAFQDTLTADLALHVGTFLAVLIYFYKDILRYLSAIIEIFIPKREVNRHDLNEVFAIIVATIPAVVVGIIFGDFIENSTRNLPTVLISLVVIAILFLFVEKWKKAGSKEFSGLNFGKALSIGLAQVLAFIPGVSRSGITIIAGLGFDLKKQEAARFAFLLSLPTIFGATLLQIISLDWNLVSDNEKISLFFLIFSSFIFGLLVIKFFLKILQKYSLKPFAYYRIILALGVLLWLIVK
ncbi:MAG: undecaprenyl-diphosphatase UppP [Patescibacteria group bacterium]